MEGQIVMMKLIVPFSSFVKASWKNFVRDVKNLMVFIPCIFLHSTHQPTNALDKIQGAYKLSEDFAKFNFRKYWTEINDVTTIWKRNVCSFIVTFNAFDVRPHDMADVQAILPFPPNPLKHVFCDLPDCGVDTLSQFC